MTALKFLSTPERRFAALASALLIVRIAVLVFGAPDLGPDEGQYWFWSKSPAFGYFSKPPFIAWSIAATTGLFGDGEWAVRLSAPLYQTGAAIFLFLLCRRLADAHAAFLAGAAWLTMPGVFLSSQLITTDAPLIFFWSAALYFFFRLTDGDDRPDRFRNAAFLGAAIGLGFLSKYAMVYFLIGAAAIFALSPAQRRAAGAAPLLLAAAVAALLIAPNIWWNAQHDFQTLSHTAANANWGRDFAHPLRLAEFLGAQFAIAGPLLLVLIVVVIARTLRNRKSLQSEDALRLLAFAAPAILIVAAQAFVSRAHANWAAVAYPSAIALAAIHLSEQTKSRKLLKGGILLNAALGGALLVAFAFAPVADYFGASSAFKRLRGWDEVGAEIAERSIGYDAIMTDDREVTGELVYYARAGRPIVAWNSNRTIDSHFEAFHLYDPATSGRVLYVSERADALYVQNRFSSITLIGEVSAPIDGRRTRTLYLFELGDLIAP